MLIILGIALLIVVIIFRNEIKNLIAYAALVILGAALWQFSWWGKAIVSILALILLFGAAVRLLETLRGKKLQ
ncbi:hypothetical protein [Paenibacillus sp. NPDC057967]|uniref:hypothetical protein n=1 Tax=Paenibacillus sp. NPDC057967 TaxID=3346293 RepID=UPI0036D8B239